MVLTCIDNDNGRFEVGKDYFCISICISVRNNTLHYRLVDKSNEIALYKPEYFVVKSSALVNMVYEARSIGGAVQLGKIAELDPVNKSANSLWERYYDYEDKELIEAMHAIIIEAAAEEGVTIPKIELPVKL